MMTTFPHRIYSPMEQFKASKDDWALLTSHAFDTNQSADWRCIVELADRVAALEGQLAQFVPGVLVTADAPAPGPEPTPAPPLRAHDITLVERLGWFLAETVAMAPGGTDCTPFARQVLKAVACTAALHNWDSPPAQLLSWWDVSHWLEREAAMSNGTEAAPTREVPLPQQGAEISDEELLETYSNAVREAIYEVPGHFSAADSTRATLAGLRAVCALEQAARPAPAPAPQLPPEQEFPLRLYQLLKQFDAELFYTRDDDGVHFSVGTSMSFGGFFGLSGLRDQVIKAGLLPDAAAAEVQP